MMGNTWPPPHWVEQQTPTVVSLPVLLCVTITKKFIPPSRRAAGVQKNKGTQCSAYLFRRRPIGRGPRRQSDRRAAELRADGGRGSLRCHGNGSGLRREDDAAPEHVGKVSYLSRVGNLIITSCSRIMSLPALASCHFLLYSLIFCIYISYINSFIFYYLYIFKYFCIDIYFIYIYLNIYIF